LGVAPALYQGTSGRAQHSVRQSAPSARICRAQEGEVAEAESVHQRGHRDGADDARQDDQNRRQGRDATNRLGVASRGIGTARAFQVNELAGTFAGLGLALNGLVTAVLAPLLIGLWR
jgi:hypothetical protein